MKDNGNVRSINGKKVDWQDSVTWYTHETTILHIIKLVGRAVFRPLAKVECAGFENIPASGPCILASNHINMLDMIFYGAHLPRHPFAMAKKELFDIPGLGWGLRKGGAFPVNRGIGDKWAITQAGRVLAAGQMLFIFPEGARGGKQAQLRRGKVGCVKLALEHRVPLIPAAIFGTQDFRYGRIRNNLIKIQVGEPLDIMALASLRPQNYATLQELTTLMMRRIAAMLPAAHRGVYGDRE